MDVTVDGAAEALWYPVATTGDVSHSRRCIAARAREAGLDDEQVARLEVIAMELGTNIVRYAAEGGGLWCSPQLGPSPCVAVVAVDSGPGISDVDRDRRDGVSTGGGLGIGLGGVQRLSDSFGIYSSRRSSGSGIGVGTIVAASVGGRPDAWVLSRRHPRESVCGDGAFARRREGRSLLAVIDGLGHGQGAAEATARAMDVLVQHADEPLDRLFLALENALRSQRGAAISVAQVGPQGLTWAGIGNVVARMVPTPVRHLITTNGTLGLRSRPPRIETLAIPHAAQLVFASDGISTRWPTDLPAAVLGHPLILAALLLRDFGRDSDDATVLVAPV